MDYTVSLYNNFVNLDKTESIPDTDDCEGGKNVPSTRRPSGFKEDAALRGIAIKTRDTLKSIKTRNQSARLRKSTHPPPSFPAHWYRLVVIRTTRYMRINYRPRLHY